MRSDATFTDMETPGAYEPDWWHEVVVRLLGVAAVFTFCCVPFYVSAGWSIRDFSRDSAASLLWRRLQQLVASGPALPLRALDPASPERSVVEGEFLLANWVVLLMAEVALVVVPARRTPRLRFACALAGAAAGRHR